MNGKLISGRIILQRVARLDHNLNAAKVIRIANTYLMKLSFACDESLANHLSVDSSQCRDPIRFLLV